MGQAHVSRQRPELDTGATDLRMPESENATQPHRSSLPESLSAKFKGIFCKDPVPELGLGVFGCQAHVNAHFSGLPTTEHPLLVLLRSLT